MSAGERECCPFTVAVIVSIESFFAQNHGSSVRTWMRCPSLKVMVITIDSFFASLRMTAAHLIMGGCIWRRSRHIHPFPPAKPCHSERSEESVHVSFADFREVSLLFRSKRRILQRRLPSRRIPQRSAACH